MKLPLMGVLRSRAQGSNRVQGLELRDLESRGLR